LAVTSNENAIIKLKQISGWLQEAYNKRKRTKKKGERPSERAMALADLQMKIQALELAIKVLREGVIHAPKPPELSHQ
jgi:hypothetical protein